MGTYLNALTPYSLYKSETVKPYFVDKTEILSELFPLVEEGSNYICITRPRRFGKTIMVNMISAFFNKEVDSKDIFDRLKIAENEKYREQFYRVYNGEIACIQQLFWVYRRGSG